jgi:sugar/nucleoside kinase (ribokinase family)
MSGRPVEIVCAGHVCLDVISRMHSPELPPPGGLTEVGAADVSTGGSVSNTGLALHRMGVAVRLVGRVGEDAFGREVRHQFKAAGADHHLQTVDGQPTGYTVVISPPDVDRRFLHCPGVNATFTDADLPDTALKGAKLLHFGYPPAMRAMCENDGLPLVQLFLRAKRHGLLTSLDTCGIAPDGWAARVDWPALLQNVLPHADLFMPSADELVAMGLGLDDLLPMGCRVAVVKDGERGLDIRTGDVPFAEGWSHRQHRAPTYVVDVVGTTGAGDTTIAGFLAGVVRGRTLENAADLACAAGARCVQTLDATSGLCSIQQLQAFIANDPARRPA